MSFSVFLFRALYNGAPLLIGAPKYYNYNNNDKDSHMFLTGEVLCSSLADKLEAKDITFLRGTTGILLDNLG